MDRKRKNATPLGAIPFIMRWAAAQIGGWLVMLILLNQTAGWFSWDTALLFSILTVAPSHLIAGVAQVWLVERGLQRTMRGWFKATVLGTALSTLIYHGILVSINTLDARTALLAILMPVAVVQTIWLSRRVKTAWLWVLAATMSSLLFAFGIRGITDNGIPQYLLMGLAALLQGVVMGGTMFYLRQHEPAHAKNEKAKNVAAAAERLSSAETDTGEEYAVAPALREQSR
jgi:hypothetical protein